MVESSQPSKVRLMRGVDDFIAEIRKRAETVGSQRRDCNRFIREIADDYAFIRLDDISHLRKFLVQMAGAPPVRFGTDGFNPTIVDDHNPARHYTAFVFVGYWLPGILAVAMLWLWEILGYVRYNFR